VQAYLVEYFSGMPFDEYAKTKMFQPLGMKDAVFGIPKEYVGRYATNYGPAEGGGLQSIDKPETSTYARYTDSPFGGLGLSSTAMDYFLFSQMLLNKGKLGDVRLLGKKTIELMASDNLPPEIGDIGSIRPGWGYGLGVGVQRSPARAGNLGSKGNFGWGGAATTIATIDLEEDMVCIFLTQYMPGFKEAQSNFQTLVYQAIID
jgi:CubicO group peptidase (beta-lactamase class C family)